MDIHCPQCGEPWDNDELHHRANEIGRDYKFVASNFRECGCKALGTNCANVGRGKARADVVSAAYELMGEDMDGAAAMMEDAERLGII